LRNGITGRTAQNGAKIAFASAGDLPRDCFFPARWYHPQEMNRDRPMLNIYLDTCCYNRPFDDLSQGIVRLEAEAKRYVQSLIKYSMINLTYSYISLYEIENNPYEYRKRHILDFLSNASVYVDELKRDDVRKIGFDIMKAGVKSFDALHIACAILANCDYFLTTDKRLLKYKTDEIRIVNVFDFATGWKEEHND
jgi:predicted nucleic acid-binding protein